MIKENDTIYDPHLTQLAVLEELEGKGLNFEDPTSPMVMIMESSVGVVTDALQEMKSNNSKIYPSLARRSEDLYHHMTQEEEINMFSSPASVYLQFELNKLDIITNGIYDDSKKQYMVTIPKDTIIEVDNLTFTLLNDVNVFIINNSSFVEERTEESIHNLSGIGNIKSAISVDGDNQEWVVFTLKVHQVRRLYFEDIVLNGIPWIKQIPLEDEYFFSRLSIRYQGQNDWQPINLLHSDAVLDPNVITIQCIVGEQLVTYSLPSIYVTAGMVADANIRVEMFTTRGKLNQPMKHYTPEDYSFTFPEKFLTKAAAQISYVGISISTPYHLDGGVNRRPFRDMQLKVIHRSAGLLDTPITERQLNEMAKMDGFNLQKVLDVLSQRVYIADKAIDYDPRSNIPSPDFFMDTVTLDMTVNTNSHVMEYGNDVIVRSNCVFEFDNGVIKPISGMLERDLVEKSRAERIDYANTNRLLTTPFYYMIDKTEDIMDARIYDLDNAFLTDVEIINKNDTIDINVNLSKYDMVKTELPDGTYRYDIYFELFGNEDFKTHVMENMDRIGGVLIFKYRDTDEKIYIHGEYIKFNNIDNLHFRIESTNWVNESDEIKITNGYSPIGSNLLTPLEETVEVIVYTKHRIDQFSGNTYYPTGEIVFNPNDPFKPNYAMALVKEKFRITFGKRLNYLWGLMSSGYTSNKYDVYNSDSKLVLTRDVYEVDPVTGCEVSITMDGDECTDVDFVVDKPAGSPLLDKDGNEIYVHRKGEIRTDPLTGEKIINTDTGIVRYLDIFMYDYRYNMITDISQIDYLSNSVKLVTGWITTNLIDMNASTLENTTIKFKTRRSLQRTKKVNGQVINSIIFPKVIVYIDDAIFNRDIINIELYKNIGKILNHYVTKSYINLRDVARDIEQHIGTGVRGVKIEGFDDEDSGIIALDKYSSRLSIDKVLTYEGYIKYNYDLVFEDVTG